MAAFEGAPIRRSGLAVLQQLPRSGDEIKLKTAEDVPRNGNASE
jgi:hypothetical protein